jgi:amino acid transporter
VKVFQEIGVPYAGSLMNFVVISAAFTASVSHLYICSRMLFSLARAGYVPKGVGTLDRRGVPLRALAVSAVGMMLAIFRAARGHQVFLPMYGTAVAALLTLWIVIFVCHFRFRRSLTPSQLEALPVRVPGYPLSLIVSIGRSSESPISLAPGPRAGGRKVMSTNGDKVFKPRRLGHANLWVGDLKRSEDFYHRVCGLTVEFWEPDLVATFLGTGTSPGSSRTRWTSSRATAGRSRWESRST